ncbi:MAG TPA: hypothetical protein VG942_05650 [Hyphomonadaceae bacterium]|nr:hypothetical protein [Hyphomonadaceae bacterium]
MRYFTFALMALAMVFGPTSAVAQLHVSVEGVDFKPVRIAVPDFDATGPGAAEAAAQLSEVVRQDLKTSAVFEIVDKSSFIQKDVDISLNPRFPDWQTINAQALLVGNVVVDADNKMTVQFRLYNVEGSQQQFATQYAYPNPLNWRRLAHKVADDV